MIVQGEGGGVVESASAAMHLAGCLGPPVRVVAPSPAVANDANPEGSGTRHGERERLDGTW